MRARILSVLLIMLSASLALAMQSASAESSGPEVSTMAAELPAPRYDSMAVWDPRDLPGIGCPDGCIYLVAGRSGQGSYADILSYNPSTDTVQVAGQLPEPLRLASAAYGNGTIYVLGGLRNSDDMETLYSDKIFEFDPITSEVQEARTTLPHRVSAASAVWSPTPTPDGACADGCAYLFGGASDASQYEDDSILRFDPARSESSIIGTLPGVRSHTAAVWDAGHGVAYVMGGRYLDGPTVFLDEIVAFDPASGQASVVGHLPQPLAYGSASFDGERAYYFGGYPVKTGSTYHSHNIIAFDPRDGSTQVLQERLPTGRVHTAAVDTGRDSFILGGYDGFPGLTEIVRYRHTPGQTPVQDVAESVVDNLQALLDNVTDEVELQWVFEAGNVNPDLFAILRDGEEYATVGWAGATAYRFVDARHDGEQHCYRVLAKADGDVLASTPAPACVDAVTPETADPTPEAVKGGFANETTQNGSAVLSNESIGSSNEAGAPSLETLPVNATVDPASERGEPSSSQGDTDNTAYTAPLNGTGATSVDEGRRATSTDPKPHVDALAGTHTVTVGEGPEVVRIPVQSDVVLVNPRLEILESSLVQADVVALPTRLGPAEPGDATLRVKWDVNADSSREGRLVFRLTSDSGSTEAYEVLAVPMAVDDDAGPLAGWWTTLFFLGAFAGTELARIGLKVIGVTSVSMMLFSRVTGARILKQPTRAAIYQAIQDSPDICYTDLRRRLRLTRGNLSYHLGRLEAEQLVRRARNGNHVTFRALPAAARGARDKDPLLEYIAENPGASQSDLARRMGVSRQLVNFRIHRLAASGRVRITRRGRATGVFLA